MININDIKNGMTIEMDGNIYLIVEFQHVKPGKGPAFIRIKLKNLRTGSITENTYNTNIKVAKANIDKKDMQYLYSASNIYYFMNMETYDQIEIRKEKISDEIKYLKEGLVVELKYYGNELLSITLPEKIDYKVLETEQAVKGNTTSGAFKDAKLENGLVIKVPLFINENDSIILSTKDGKYQSKN